MPVGRQHSRLVLQAVVSVLEELAVQLVVLAVDAHVSLHLVAEVLPVEEPVAIFGPFRGGSQTQGGKGRGGEECVKV